MESPDEKNNLTPSQQRAVAARGNVLVMAGAGTGKTHTLVERCLDLLCEERASLDEILIVTFTEAAAIELRRRLRAALEKKSRENTDPFFTEQLALFDDAHLGTLHGFCFKLIREHFHELGLDPQIAMLDEGEARLLADETLDEQFQSHYEGEDEFSLAVQNLIQVYGNGRDEKIRALVLRLHNYSQTRPDADAWLARQIEIFSVTEPAQWREWFSEAISSWLGEWLPILESLRAENVKAAECLEILKNFPECARVSLAVSGFAPETPATQIASENFYEQTAKRDASESTRDACAPHFQKILAADFDWPRGTKKFRKPLEDFFDDAKFLDSLAITGKNDPLAEDWNWIRSHMKTLLRLTQEFEKFFSERKRADGALDFHDLEQCALKLLWDFAANRPAQIAERWREKLRFIFVDEYQDINAAQDKIISALSRAGANANRFLVGDVKQSIYRFRLADPKIFRDYSKSWRGKNGQTIPLAENFRSRELILDFVNSIFEPLMREETGGVNYGDEAKLKFGSPETRSDFSAEKDSSPRAELLLRIKTGRKENAETENGDDDFADLEEAEKESRVLALRLLELKNSGHEIWDDERKIFRAVEWRDMVILLRAPSGKSEIFAKQFARAGIPLAVARAGFFASGEILDLLSLLQLLDNPLQDVPCIAVLRSPLVGCSLAELAEIRLVGKGHFWFVLNQVQNPKTKIQSETRAKIQKFRERFHRWRKLAQQSSLSQCLETVLAETHFDDWLKSRPHGAKRHANVGQFLNLAQKFDQFQRQGLFRFLKFIAAQREAEIEPEIETVVEENAVRLMSIHQSKGLEFPVVVLADLRKGFNEQDLRDEIILDERFGLCPRVKPPASGGRYPSLAYRLAQKNQRRELRGEELRLLYVALTRARDTLILSASVSEKKWKTIWTQPAEITPQKIVAAKSCADWLGLWFSVQSSASKVQNAAQGELPHLRWRIASDEELIGKIEIQNPKSEMELPKLDDAAKEKLRDVLDWHYEFQDATQRAAKSSVTALRRLAADELDEEAAQIFDFRFSKKRLAGTLVPPGLKLNAVDAGAATHKFLEHFQFESAANLPWLEAESRRLEKENYLSADESAALDLPAVAEFWNSDFGKKIRTNAANVKRELAFTAKFVPEELDKILRAKSGENLEKEFIVVQGIVDLAVLLAEEIWLMDFKTDEFRVDELPGKIKIYAPQLKLYALALEKIYSRPVTECRLHFLAIKKTVAVEI